MKEKLFFLLSLLALSLSGDLRAEGGCPPGMHPITGQGWTGCAPIPGYDNSAAPPSQAPPVHRGWIPSWGAIATDVEAKIFGTSTYAADRNGAETLAIMDCETHGGKNCKIETWFSNSCAAIAVGDKTHSNSTADKKRKAEKESMKACKEKDENCRIYYSACSDAVEIID